MLFAIDEQANPGITMDPLCAANILLSHLPLLKVLCMLHLEFQHVHLSNVILLLKDHC